MVRGISFIALFWLGLSTAGAAPVETFLGSSDPAYVQAVAPRFTTWIFNNYEVVPTEDRAPWKILLLQESSNLAEWTFMPWPEQSWPRLQFSVSFFKGVEKDAVIFVLPTQKEKSFQAVQKLLSLPMAAKKDWLGFGFSLKSPEVYIYSLESNPKVIKDLKSSAPQISGETFIKRTVFLNGKQRRIAYLAPLQKPEKSGLSFSPLVSTWRGWFDSAGQFLSYDVVLSNFNFQFLDGAAVGTTRKINREFLLENLRLDYRANDDYDVLYP